MARSYYSKYEPIFGSWRITAELGSGAEGHLYRICRKDALGNVFYSALKAVTIPAGGDEEIESLTAGGMSREEAEKYFTDVLEKSSQEFELLEKLKGNSNVVSYEDHEVFRRDDCFGWDILIRMEELTPLVKHSVYHGMDEEELIKMGIDLCRGLELCRKYDIVHRDIKPDNIFISRSGSYKIGDFGIARIIEKMSPSLSRKGTYAYMAPEVYMGREYDHSADVYSLGMVMYLYMNDGRMPFMPYYPEPVGYDDREVAFTRRVSGEEDLPEPRNGSAALKAVIMKACTYDPAKRYTEASDMLRDLEAISRNDTAALEALSGSASKRETARTSGKRIAAAAAAVLIAGGLAVYTLVPKEVEDIEIAGLEDGGRIYIGEETAPEYTVKPDWFRDEPVSFEVDGGDIVTVDEEGRLHAGDIPGEAVLTVHAKDYSEDVHISVVPKVTEITGIDRSISLTTGEDVKLEPVRKPDKFADEPVTYSVEDRSVAEVDGDGTLKALSAGETILTVSSGGAGITAKVTVSDPVVYTQPSGSRRSSGSSKKSGSKKKSSSGSGKASKGTFDPSDDESF